MAFTEDNIRTFADWFKESDAKSLAQFPSTFGIVTGIDEIARGWRLEVSDDVATSVELLKLVASAENLPEDFLPASLTQEYAIEDPLVDEVAHEGMYRNSSVQVFRQMETGTDYFYIIQILRKGWIESLDDGEGGIDWSEFRDVSERHYHSGRTMIVLRLRGVAAGSVRDICDALNAYDNFSDMEYFNDTADGDWFKILVSSDIENDGSYAISVYIADQYGIDMIFPYYSNERERRALFLKYNMAPSELEDFKAHFYFDESGNYYYATDDANYTKMNGDDTESTALPADAKILNDNPSNRTIIEYSAAQDKEAGSIDIRVYLSWSDELNSESGTIIYGRYGEVVTQISLNDVGSETRDNFLEYTYIASSGHWYYSENGSTYTKMDGATASGSLPTSYKLGTNVEGRRGAIRSQLNIQTNRWTVLVEFAHVSADQRCGAVGGTVLSYSSNNKTAITIDLAYNLSRSQLAAAFAYYTTPADGVNRQISQPRRDEVTGLYSFEAIEITTTPIATSFRVGPEIVYVGYNYKKKPTTDATLFNADNPPETEGDGIPVSDNYYLIGGYFVSTSTWATDISATSTVVGGPELNQANNTWNWRIRHISPATQAIGQANPTTQPSTDFIFEYGDDHDYMRYVGHYDMQTIVLNSISLKSYWEDIPADMFGTDSALTDRRKVIPIIRNENIVDGKLTFDLWERVLTPDINDDDGWYYMGATEALERNKETLVNEKVLIDGEEYDTTTHPVSWHLVNFAGADISTLVSAGSDPVLLSDLQYSGDKAAPSASSASDFAILSRLQLASKRRKVVHRYRKYFLRRPTTSDLTNTIDSGSDSIKDTWDYVKTAVAASSPSALIATTFDIIQVNGMWAVEKMVVEIDPAVYVDTDAFDHSYDSDGNTMLGLMFHAVHAGAGNGSTITIPDTFTDQTEA